MDVILRLLASSVLFLLEDGSSEAMVHVGVVKEEVSGFLLLLLLLGLCNLIDSIAFQYLVEWLYRNPGPFLPTDHFILCNLGLFNCCPLVPPFYFYNLPPLFLQFGQPLSELVLYRL